ncbi:class I adenylate-forming enzyme family protein [Saccharothrix coeruleofusca]|uniref:Acyl-CoA synthetase n=1 Tax=Saccharothrix coeruleofusca TaxID=33919 RepID=A0A918EGX2_9PSEU|nr:class I adenylate-forming enzyme family protein [Saccharothrix coeruleofusca]GGP51720.1 acyl-CoA synthetase [Saccharothrix coeruleofusca]GGP85051.1 acyl-CoA synthetase [Saccharothrix coeruleofusca]
MTHARTTATMSRLVHSLLARQPDSVALVVDGERALTRGQWASGAARIAGGLVARGVRPGDRIAVLCGHGDWIDHVVAVMGVHLAGGAVVTLSPDLPEEELARRLDRCGVTGLVHTAAVQPPTSPGWTALTSEVDGEPIGLPVEVDPREIAEILHTSGTTGQAKAVAVSHANLTHGRGARGAFLGDNPRLLCAVPIGTNAGHSATMLALTSSGETHVLSDPDPASAARAIARSRIGAAVVSPWAIQRWLADDVPNRCDLGALRVLMLGSTAVPMATISALSRALPDVRVLLGYGSTEAVPASVHHALAAWNEHADPAYHRLPRTASQGRPAAGTEVSVVDERGEPVPPGVVGEIRLRTTAPQRWYLGDPDRNREVFADGWTRMGDYGSLDEDGHLHFFDRIPDAIRTAGALVSSARVENALLWHPNVVEAAAFGIPDIEAGHLVAAAVVLDSPVPEGDLLDFARSELTGAEVPVRVFVVDSLPRGDNGKPLKRVLRVRFADG